MKHRRSVNLETLLTPEEIEAQGMPEHVIKSMGAGLINFATLLHHNRELDQIESKFHMCIDGESYHFLVTVKPIKLTH